jgi:hypothetical protein
MKIIFAITVFLCAYFGNFVGIFIGKAQEKQDLVTPSRYMNMTELGFITGKTQNSLGYGNRYQQYITSASIHSFHGYRFSHYFALGTVVGIDWYDFMTLMPLQIGVRGDFAKKRVTPFYAIDIGHSAAWLTANEQTATETFIFNGGLTASVGLGIKVYMDKKTALLFTFGYKRQAAEAIYQSRNYEDKQVFNFNRLYLRMGFCF